MVAMPENQRIPLSDMLREYESKNTRRIYVSVLKDYLGFIYPECKAKIDEKREELDVRYLPPGVKMEILDEFSLQYIDSKRDLRDDLLSYREHIAKQAPKSKALKLAAINQFLKVNGITMPDQLSRRLFSFKESGAISEEDIPTNEDLKRIAEYLPIHGKALMLVLASGGMRGDEAIQLRDEDIDFTSDPVKIRLSGNITKSGKKRIAFISPEAVEAVGEWLKFRPQYLETAGGRSKNKRDGKEYSGMLFPFTSSNFNKIWNNALAKVGLLKRDKRTGRVTMSPHKLRKFFRLRVGKYGRDEAEALMGHQTGMNAVYARFVGQEGEQRLASAYKLALPELMIHDRSVVIQRADKAVRDSLRRHEDAIDVLEAENRRLAGELEEYKTAHTALGKTVIDMGRRFEQLEHRYEREIDEVTDALTNPERLANSALLDRLLEAYRKRTEQRGE